MILTLCMIWLYDFLTGMSFPPPNKTANKTLVCYLPNVRWIAGIKYEMWCLLLGHFIHSPIYNKSTGSHILTCHTLVISDAIHSSWTVITCGQWDRADRVSQQVNKALRILGRLWRDKLNYSLTISNHMGPLSKVSADLCNTFGCHVLMWTDGLFSPLSSLVSCLVLSGVSGGAVIGSLLAAAAFTVILLVVLGFRFQTHNGMLHLHSVD